MYQYLVPYNILIIKYIPISISLIENFASSEQYLISADVIKSIAPPKQYPYIPTITGTLILDKDVIDNCQSFIRSYTLIDFLA